MVHFLRYVGAFHPIAVHFPIGLLMVAAIMEGIAAWRRDNSTFGLVVSINLHLGTVAAFVAAVLGWADAATMGVEPDLKPILFWHRWLGTGVAFDFLVILALWYWQRAVPNGKRIWLYRISLWLGAVLVGVTGHLGGTLVYGIGYLSWPQ